MPYTGKPGAMFGAYRGPPTSERMVPLVMGRTVRVGQAFALASLAGC
jgi:hypothetical protein